MAWDGKKLPDALASAATSAANAAGNGAKNAAYPVAPSNADRSGYKRQLFRDEVRVYGLDGFRARCRSPRQSCCHSGNAEHHQHRRYRHRRMGALLR